MPRPLLISTKNGRDLKTYGVRKVRGNMKFSFIICIVIAFGCCECVRAGARIFDDYKYLEHLNDLDRRNVEFEYDLHKQWPFHVTADREEEEERTEPEETNLSPENLMKIKEIVNMARAEMATRHHSNYHDSFLLDRIENGFKHMKDSSDRANQLSQYLRYKTPSSQDRLEEARMYPPEEDFTFNEEDEEEEENEDDNNKYFQDTEDFGPEDEDDQYKMEPIIEPKPLYTRLNPIRIAAEPERIPLSIENEPEEEHEDHMHHGNYEFKEGEEFPETISFHEVPLVEDPGEFGVGPSDPRFYRDSIKLGNIISVTPRHQNQELNIPRPHPTEKSRAPEYQNEIQDQDKSIILNEESSKVSSSDRDVEVVPYKPDTPADTAGVYIIAVVAGISAAATVGLIAVGIGWYNLQKHMKNAEDTDYPSYGIVGPNKDYEKKERDDAGDRRLAQSAQMYHYQHQKQQIIAMGRNPQGHGSQSDTEEEEDEEGNYTVYECPGLASIEGPLEVKNPMFDDNQLATPSQTPSRSTNADQNTK